MPAVPVAGALPAPAPHAPVTNAFMTPGPGMIPGGIDAETLTRHVGRAQQIVNEKPDSAVIALRQMLQPATMRTTPDERRRHHG
jgi:flagellar M-ring protein FliF